MKKELAYVQDERTGRYVLNPNYKTPVVETTEEVIEATPAIEEVVANAEESANENVVTTTPVKVKKVRAKKSK